MEPQAPGADAPASEPAVPVTPAEPAAPVEPVAPDGGAEPTAEEAAQAAEDKEWEDAADEIFPGLKKTTKKEEEKPDEPAKPEEKPQEGAADEAAATDKKPEAEQGAGDDATPFTPSAAGGWGDTEYVYGSFPLIPGWASSPAISDPGVAVTTSDVRIPIQVDDLMNEAQWFYSTPVGFNSYQIRAISFEGINLGVRPDLS